MTLSETLEAASSIVDSYPNGGRDAGKSYLGALAAMLGSYPRQVAMKCADPVKGIVRDCKFLPTPADIVSWCEKETEPLLAQVDRDIRLERQFAEREEFENLELHERPRRRSIRELKEKFGDWNDDWRPLGSRAAELCEAGRKSLVEQIGQAAFDALPDAPQREAAE